MTLPAGTRLGPYEVSGPLGSGGMGEVYRARDTRLAREVAIKVLPAELASDPERLKRFEKEARSASSLNHPNIVTIYDIGQEDSVSYIAMERVEGSTLRESLLGGPLAVRRLLAIAAQIAEGLAKAHEAGIVHRDLKPENVMVTKDGLVKVLDFGLAKLTSTMSGSSEGSQLPTMTGTTPGVIVGTVGYMSPEQAGGASLDFRSDQFALGSMLYEMATGRKAFQRKTAIDTLAAILNEDPEPVGSVNPQTPLPLRWIVERCLAKEPRQRYASTEDLARDLGTLRDRLAEATSSDQPIGVAPRRARPRIAWAAAAIASLLVAGALFWAGRTTAKPTHPSFRQLTFRRGAVFQAFFAPDGRTIVYSASWDGQPVQLYSARLDSPGSAVLPLPIAELFGISSSGELAISIGRTLARVPLGGGGPREVLDGVLQADWSPDGSDLAVVHVAEGGLRLEYPIGKTLYETSGFLRYPRVSPRGDLVAFLDHPMPPSHRGSVAVVDRDGKKRTLSPDWSELHTLAWSPTGEEVWFSGARAGTSWDGINSVSLDGRERAVLRGAGGFGIEDISRDGRALVTLNIGRSGIAGLVPGTPVERDLSWLSSSEVRDISADGTTVLFSESGAGASSVYHDVYIRKTDGSPAVRLGEGDPRSLSPDGKRALVVVNTVPPKLELVPTGAGEKRTLERGDIIEYFWADWFPDGRRVFFTGQESDRKPRVYVQEFGGGKPKAVTREVAVGSLAISPDGKHIVARHPDRRFALFPLDGGEPRPIPGMEPEDRMIRFGESGDVLFVERRSGNVARLLRLGLDSGKRELLKEVAPDPAGLDSVGGFRVTPDGRFYVYTYARVFADLYLVEGLE